ncbi:Lipid phosphate phosphatase delta [Abeliophyllum distichum]|uniref:Lipid phosphate phosphatase delta n=2 Tax=Abeliophyllum distichum TaxID=126358 RepID=A0ABD1VCS7_9LAMI
MESIPGWQVIFLGGIATWIVFSSILNVTQKLRSLTQPWVSHYVMSGTSIVLKIQKYEHRYLDAFFSGLSCVVSVPFYTAFLPLLFWSGHCKLARQMTLLMAFCDYMGNCIKDVVSAPRPSSPPVRRVTATKDEEDNAMEYGLPSSHTLNTVCLSGYLLHYILSYTGSDDVSTELMGVSLVCLVVGLIGVGRIYLGMHSLIDIIGGLALGLGILTFWLSVDKYIDDFVVSGQMVASFWATLSFLLLFAYPTPGASNSKFRVSHSLQWCCLGHCNWDTANIPPVSPRKCCTLIEPST